MSSHITPTIVGVSQPVYFASSAASQFATTRDSTQYAPGTAAAVSPTFLAPEAVLIDGEYVLEESEDESLTDWPGSEAHDFYQPPSLPGCFISSKYIFVDRKATDPSFPEYRSGLSISSGAYGVESGDFSTDIVHAEIAGGTDTLELVASLLAEGIPAAPEYAFTVTPRWKYGPASAPIVPGPSIPSIGTSLEGSVNVIDSFGANANSAAAFHGNFVAGIINRLGVGTRGSNVGIADSNFAPEFAVATAIVQGVNNVSLGGHDCVASGGVLVPPPIGIAAVLMDTSDITIVASAGNASTLAGCHNDEFPARYASFDDALIDTFDEAVQPYYRDISTKVVSVGALSGTKSAEYTRASFSNCGDNTVWAPGVGIVSDYPDNDLSANQYQTAVWAGTSFAAPVVAAALALNEFSYP
jgi:hypothetical protein